ncbi:MFS sugar transporter [Fonsecaea pedrosoi]|nr:MFS sugar transporter [Fonsecaea pedrosoi]
MHEINEKGHVRVKTVLMVLTMSMASASMGMTASVISTTLGQPSFIVKMGLDGPNGASLTGAVTSLYYVGATWGAFVHGWFANRYGRKPSIIFAICVTLVSQALLTGAANVAMFIVFRFFLGWGGFQAICGVPLWISEIVPPRHRGKLSDIHAVMINVGYSIIGFVGVGFYYYDSPDAWRAPLGIAMVPEIIFLAGCWWLPESPRYLIARNQSAKAWKILRALHADPSDPSDEFAKREFYQIHEQIRFDQSQDTSWKLILTRPSYRKRALISAMLSFSIMSAGLIVIQNYGVTLYSELGYTGVDTLLLQSGYTLTLCVASMIAITFVDKVSRRNLMGTGFALQCICLIIYTALVANFLTGSNKSAQTAAVAFIYLFGCSFELCLDGPEFFYIQEIWPSHLRAQGGAIAFMVYNAINICWLQAAPTAFESIGWKFFLVFIIFAALGSITVFVFFPDTLHKPMEEIADMFGDPDLVVVHQTAITSELVEARFLEMLGDGTDDPHTTSISVQETKGDGDGPAVHSEKASV